MVIKNQNPSPSLTVTTAQQVTVGWNDVASNKKFSFGVKPHHVDDTTDSKQSG